MDNRKPPTSWIDLESVRTLAEAVRMTSLSRTTLLYTYPDLCIRISQRRWGIKLKDILAIANGTAQQTGGRPK
jgi:hypothetical protein